MYIYDEELTISYNPNYQTSEPGIPRATRQAKRNASQGPQSQIRQASCKGGAWSNIGSVLVAASSHYRTIVL